MGKAVGSSIQAAVIRKPPIEAQIVMREVMVARSLSSLVNDGNMAQ